MTNIFYSLNHPIIRSDTVQVLQEDIICKISFRSLDSFGFCTVFSFNFNAAMALAEVRRLEVDALSSVHKLMDKQRDGEICLSRP